MSITSIFLLSTSLLNLLLTFLVFSRNRNSKVNRSFSVFLINAAIWPLAILFFRSSTDMLSASAWAKLIYISGTLVPTTLLVFTHLITNSKTHKLFSPSLFISTGFFIYTILFKNLFIQKIVLNSIGNSVTLSPLNYLWIAYFTIAMTIGTNQLYNKLKKSTGYEKIQLRFVLISILFAILGAYPFNIILPSIGIYRYIYLGPIGLLITTIIISYAIIKHRFFDIRLVVSKTIAYLLLLSALGFAYSFGVTAITRLLFPQLIALSSRQFIITSTSLTLITAITFQPLRKLFEKITDNILYKDKLDTEDLLHNISQTISSNTSLNGLARNALEAICNNIKISNASILFLENNQITSTRSFGNAYKIENSDIKALNSKKGMIVFDEISERNPAKEIMRAHNIYIAQSIKLKGKTIALLLLGPKKSGDMYYYEQDLDVLKIIAPELAIAIQNALAYEKIKHFNYTLRKKVNDATKKLKNANRNLRHLDKLKDEFVFVATHELKNPVTAMKGYLSMIDEGSFGKIPEKLKEPMNQLNQSNQQLVKLVNDLLQIARSEAQTLSIDIQELNICTAIEQIIEATRPLADQKKILINYVCLKKEILVKADPDRLKEVFNNLITNAIKYSEKGTITIKYAEEKDHVIVHVKDEGVGIAKKDQPKIFTRFFRVEEEAAKGIPGSGLGLFIVRQLVEKMGGKIWFTSKYGKGSTFSFSLPKVKK